MEERVVCPTGTTETMEYLGEKEFSVKIGYTADDAKPRTVRLLRD